MNGANEPKTDREWLQQIGRDIAHLTEQFEKHVERHFSITQAVVLFLLNSIIVFYLARLAG